MMPSLSVVHTEPSRRRKVAPALSSPPKPKTAVEQPRGKPFEPNRHFVETALELRRDPIDQPGADYRLADRGLCAPLRTVPEQVVDGDRQVVIGRQQTGPRA